MLQSSSQELFTHWLEGCRFVNLVEKGLFEAQKKTFSSALELADGKDGCLQKKDREIGPRVVELNGVR